MKRRKPLPKSTKRIRRSSSRIAPRKKDAKTRRFAKHRNAAFQGWVREQPCVVGEKCWGKIECCHVKPRSTGGHDVGNSLAMCSFHHVVQHTVGILTFQKRFNVDLGATAKALADQWAGQEGAA